MGLLGLMLLHESRRAARTSSDGDLILLEQQDRSLWNRDQIAEGISLTESALRSRRFGAYTLQAAIAAVHAESPSVASTDWRQITLLYDQLLRVQPSPVVELNRAVAVAMCEGVEQGLDLIDDLLAREHLSQYHLAHSAVRICAADQGESRRPVLRMRRLLPWRPRHRTAVFSPGGLQN
ncbi:MAG: DUF6596 domain-containing protein [Candidatus Acidiferrum sp.]|jgi:RNA polymerase sigma-70 factor (ECF subfamily)